MHKQKTKKNKNLEETARDIVKSRLNQSLIFKALEKLSSEQSDTESITQVIDLIEFSYTRTKTIVKYMNEYTLHDEVHLFRVLKIMEKILGQSNIDKLVIPELMLLILSAFYHDIGMAPNEEKVELWKSIWDTDFETKQSELSEDKIKELELIEFIQFLKPFKAQVAKIHSLHASGLHSQSENIKAHLISEYIRRTHADRARTIIQQKSEGKLKYKEFDLTLPLANICYSHNDDAYTLLDFPIVELVSSDEYISIPLISIILRLADILDFDGNRTPDVLFSHLQIKNPISLKEWEKHRSVDAWHISEKAIIFSATCTHPAIELSIRNFCDLIDKELASSNNIIYRLEADPKFKEREIELRIPLKVVRENIKAKRNIQNEPLYEYCETKFELNKNQVIKLLMGTELYSNPEEAIRELLQNSIDACKLRLSLEQEWGNTFTPEISINYLKEGEDYFIEVIDNGRGMDKEIIDKYFSKIGQSYYKSDDFYSVIDNESSFKPISRFGIGILSCFMISNDIDVSTKMVIGNYQSSDALHVKIEGEDSLFWIRKGIRDTIGTTIKLKLNKESNPWKDNTSSFFRTLDKILLNPQIPISVNAFGTQQSYVEIDFDVYDWTELKGDTWKENEFTKYYEIKYDNFEEDGFRGKALIAVLVNNEGPFLKNKLDNLPVDVNSVKFELKRDIVADGRSNKFSSTSITYDKEGKVIDKEDSIRTNSSKSKFSLHGIEVDHSLLTYNTPSLHWPMPMLLIVDVGGIRDLDLNAARTKIRDTEKWKSFEEVIATRTIQKLKEQMDPDFFKAYINTISDNYFNSTIFQNILQSEISASA